ncbi:hypothetical protein I6N95_26525 [Vagococcus sp. BWB3-3]|uniref:Uncharacterized protein n=1 Tax=Vagococcus allomyrinae TaxID=2794353 RepID=A0A940PJ80_9ENTE|nr:hypothetical protein [Vagococcus allomyrinae]MBP1044571.1 hypothetical protein [Vagococcus allomyrinae]
MKKKQAQIGNFYQGKSELLKNKFTGKVLSKLTNVAIIHITEWNPKDDYKVKELVLKIAVKYSDLTPIQSNTLHPILNKLNL